MDGPQVDGPPGDPRQRNPQEAERRGKPSQAPAPIGRQPTPVARSGAGCTQPTARTAERRTQTDESTTFPSLGTPEYKTRDRPKSCVAEPSRPVRRGVSGLCAPLPTPSRMPTHGSGPMLSFVENCAFHAPDVCRERPAAGPRPRTAPYCGYQNTGVSKFDAAARTGVRVRPELATQMPRLSDQTGDLRSHT